MAQTTTTVGLGDRVKDRITGLVGIVTARTEFLYGCVRIQVQPEKLDKDKKVAETGHFDEAQVEIVKPLAVRGFEVTVEARADPRLRPAGPRDATRRAQATRR